MPVDDHHRKLLVSLLLGGHQKNFDRRVLYAAPNSCSLDILIFVGDFAAVLLLHRLAAPSTVICAVVIWIRYQHVR